jgi:hypothetical protein
MASGLTLRRVFAYLEDAERLGMFVRCPRYRAPTEIFDCVTCPCYRGLVTGDRETFRLRCVEPDPIGTHEEAPASRSAA